jgi:tRNA pseudouridine32 synthase/23S rRNA pseudouridine746 synthase
MKLYYQKLFKRESGIIDLPLGEIRKIDPIKLWIGKGEKLVKPILKLLGKEGNYSRLEFIPYTGRTHRIRVHSQQGLGIGIFDDRLYNGKQSDRLYLHAKRLSFRHPQTETKIDLIIPTPFESYNC